MKKSVFLALLFAIVMFSLSACIDKDTTSQTNKTAISSSTEATTLSEIETADCRQNIYDDGIDYFYCKPENADLLFRDEGYEPDPEVLETIKATYRTASDDNLYTICDYKDGVCIVRYNGNAEKVLIPDELEGKKVVKIGSFFEDYRYSPAFSDNDGVIAVVLPEYLKEVEKECFSHKGIKEYFVNEDNPYYTAENGLLYNKDKTVLLSVPPKYNKKVIDIANGTRFVRDCISKFTEIIRIPSSVEQIDFNYTDGYMFNRYVEKNLMENEIFKSFEVDSENKFYSSENGVLYNKDKTELYIIPENLSCKDDNLVLPDNLETTSYYDISDIKNIHEITFGKNIKSINLTTDIEDTNFDEYVKEEYQWCPRSSVQMVKGYKGTAAEEWAEGYWMEFVALD